MLKLLICANSVDPDQVLQTVASEQGLHSLPLIQQLLVATTGSEMNSWRMS